MESVDERQKFFADLNAAYKKLRESPKDWQEEQEERKEWDVTLNDGLEDES